ncbi:MAG: NAD(P)-dependent oxidoreductase, partial [Cellvibrionales bacterium]|nr:NAD(P)-dependent oxidoreductase [Cellvibrionales bacterium]
MPIILFGATGYLGSHAAEQLILLGLNPICIVRKGSKSQFLPSINATCTPINFDDHEALTQVIPEGSTVINCIADTRTHATYAQKKVVEIELTRRLFQAASAKKAKRFIQLSTVMAYGFNRPPEPINENYPTTGSFIYNQVAIDREQIL